MKVFIAGPRAISNVFKDVEQELDNIINRKISVLIGDAFELINQFKSILTIMVIKM